MTVTLLSCSPFPLSISTASLPVSSRAPYLAAVPRAPHTRQGMSYHLFQECREKLLSPQSWPLTGDLGVGLICLHLIGGPPPDGGAAKLDPDLAADKGLRVPNFDPADPSSLLTTMYRTPDSLASAPFSLEATPDSLHPRLGGHVLYMFCGVGDTTVEEF